MLQGWGSAPWCWSQDRTLVISPSAPWGAGGGGLSICEQREPKVPGCEVTAMSTRWHILGSSPQLSR